MAGAPWADPTRLYAEARRSRMALDAARATCAASIGGRAEELVFTSGGTEANVLAVQGGVRAALAARRPARVLVSAIEQRSILDTAAALPDVEIVVLPVDHAGRLDLDALDDALDGGAALVSVQLANGEIGTTQAIPEIAARVHAAKAWLHVDATFALGWIPVDVRALDADLLTFSGHHAFGPKGTGGLWIRRGVRVRPLLQGDDRERSTRAGMPALESLVGLGAALAARTSELDADVPRLTAQTAASRDRLAAIVDDVLVHGDAEARLPHIVSFTVPLVEGEALLAGLDARGFAVHSGSACTSSAGEPSHVLAAIGTLTHGAIRVSIGPSTTDADLEGFLATLPEVVSAARARLRSRA